MKSIQEQKLDQAFRKAIEPPLKVDIISHSEQSIWLSSMFTDTKNVGFLKLSKTPYLKYILKTVFDEDMDLIKISFCAGTQCGKTTAIMAILSYIICHRPGPTMMLMPTASTAKALSKDRLQVIFKDSPAIREELTGSDDDFQLLNYLFKNMSLSLVHSETQVRSRPVKYLLQDEIAVIDPFIVKSSLDRTKSFSGRKIISVSSPEFPTDPIWKSLGIIRDYEEEKIVTQEGGTLGGIPIRRYKQNPKSSTVCHWYHVKCPHCNQSQQLFPDLLRWKRFDKKTKKTIPIWQLGSDDNTWYECSNCHGRIYDRHKKTMVVNGEWKNETGVVGKSISFQINSLYTLLGDACQWSEIVAIWLNAKGDPDAERSVVNSFFAFPYVAEEFGENVISMEKIKKLSESAGYRRNTIPDEVLILTSGIDVQKDQMYWSTYGHSEDGTRYLIAYGFEPFAEDQPFEMLEKRVHQIVDMELRKNDGTTMSSVACGIDSGYRTDEVYEMCRRRRNKLVPVKGGSKAGRSKPSQGIQKIIQTSNIMERFPGSRRPIPGGIRLFTLNTDYGKTSFLQGLNNGRVILPIDIDQNAIDQLNSEKKVVKVDKLGRVSEEFVTKKLVDKEDQNRKISGSQNHWLDTSIYAHAMLDCIDPSLTIKQIVVKLEINQPKEVTVVDVPDQSQSQSQSHNKNNSALNLARKFMN